MKMEGGTIFFPEIVISRIFFKEKRHVGVIQMYIQGNMYRSVNVIGIFGVITVV